MARHCLQSILDKLRGLDEGLADENISLEFEPMAHTHNADDQSGGHSRGSGPDLGRGLVPDIGGPGSGLAHHSGGKSGGHGGVHNRGSRQSLDPEVGSLTASTVAIGSIGNSLTSNSVTSSKSTTNSGSRGSLDGTSSISSSSRLFDTNNRTHSSMGGSGGGSRGSGLLSHMRGDSSDCLIECASVDEDEFVAKSTAKGGASKGA